MVGAAAAPRAVAVAAAAATAAATAATAAGNTAATAAAAVAPVPDKAAEARRAFNLELVQRMEEQDVASVLGARRAKAYCRLLERAQVPQRVLQFLPEMNASDKYLVGRQTGRLYRRIGISYHNKPKKEAALLEESAEEARFSPRRGLLGDAAGEGGSSGSEDSASDEETGHGARGIEDDGAGAGAGAGAAGAEDASASTSAPALAPMRASGPELVAENPMNKLEHVIEQEHERVSRPLLMRDQIALEFSRDRYKLASRPIPACVPAEHLAIATEKVATAIPGFAALDNAVSKSRGGEDFFSYWGRWSNGALQGDGVFLFADGGTYRGAFQDSLPHGDGAAEYPCGARYQGRWARGLRHGPGREETPDGTVFEGVYELGVRTGPGRMRLKSGTVYEGDFVEGQFHGRGALVSALGWTYEGSWVRGQVCGSGVLIDKEQKRIPRTWKACSFRDAVHQVEAEREHRVRHKMLVGRRVRAALDDMNLQRQVQNFRNRMAEAKEAELQAQLDEIERIRFQRRADKRKAKDDMLANKGDRPPAEDQQQQEPVAEGEDGGEGASEED
jgi:hypothetical protein